jgi:hypothetical protein
MNIQEVYNDIENEFPHEIALGVSVCVALNSTQKPNKKDVLEEGRYTKRLNKKIDSALAEYNSEDAALIKKLAAAYHDFTIGKLLGGLGSCTKKSLRELIGE